MRDGLSGCEDIGDQCGVTSKGIGEEMAFLSILGTIKKVMVNHFLCSRAYGTVGCVTFVNAMEVMIEWDTMSVELDV